MELRLCVCYFSGEVISSFDYFAVCSTIIFTIDFANFKIRILTACVFLCLSFCIIHSLFCFTQTPSYSLKIIICHENMYYFMFSILIAYCTRRDRVVFLNMFYFYVPIHSNSLPSVYTHAVCVINYSTRVEMVFITLFFSLLFFILVIIHPF